VVVVPLATVPKVVEATQARLAKEEKTRAVLASGTLGLDYYGMRERLAEKGLRYVNTPADA